MSKSNVEGMTNVKAQTPAQLCHSGFVLCSSLDFRPSTFSVTGFDELLSADCASTICFMLVSPSVNLSPIILSMSKNMQNAFSIKQFVPFMAQVTLTFSPSGLNVNTASAVSSIGLTNASFIRTNSFG